MEKTDLNKAAAALLSRRGMLIPGWLDAVDAPSAGFGPARLHALTAVANLGSLGVDVEPEISRLLSWQPMDTLAGIYGVLDRSMREAVGAHRDFAPMYPGFPAQVIDADDAELLSNAHAHYAGAVVGLRVLPAYAKVARTAEALAKKSVSMRVISEDAAASLAAGIVKAPSSASKDDMALVASVWKAFASKGELPRVTALASGSANKENMAAAAVVAASMGDNGLMSSLSLCTDALRAACAMSDGDVSLAKPTKFKSMGRPARRALLSVVERHLSAGDSEQALENMFSRREQWLRLGEKLHPGEMAKSHPLASAVFARLRSGLAPVPFGRLVADADCDESVRLLSSRPGEFARRLASLSARFPGRRADVLSAFSSVADRVPPTLLLQARHAFSVYSEGPVPFRSFMPKGGLGRVFLKDGEKSVDASFATSAASLCEEALLSAFAKMPPLGKVWVDPALDGMNVPFAARSASRSLRSMARGSRSPVDGAVARLFVWWSEKGVDSSGKDMRPGLIDVDLSCLFLDADFNSVGHVSWTALRGGGVTHSGDITSAPNGACEFIDVDFAKVDPSVKYVCVSVNSFSGQKFSEMPECFCGWMGRDSAMDGKLFEPASVLGRSDLAMESTSSLPVILDMDRRMAVWADLSLGTTPGYAMVERQSKMLSHMARAVVSMSKPTLGELFTLHARARGSLTQDRAEADTVFSAADGDAHDFAKVLSFLAVEPEAAVPARKPKP